MILFHDILKNCELFTDATKLLYDEDEVLVGVPVKYIKKGGGIDESLIGGNASAENEDHGDHEDQCQTVLSCEEYCVSKVDLDFFDKKVLKKYWVKYFKSLMTKLKDDDEKEQCNNVKAIGEKAITKWLSMYDPKEIDIFAHESFSFEETNQPLFIGVWSESGMEVTLWTIKACLCEEKC